jgi:hypothetical protein
MMGKNNINIRIKSNIKLDYFEYDFKNSKIGLKLKDPQYYNVKIKYKNNKEIITIN